MVTYPRLRANQKCYANFLGKNLSTGVAQTTSMEVWKTYYRKLLGKNLCACVAQTKAWQYWDTKLLTSCLSTDVTKKITHM